MWVLKTQGETFYINHIDAFVNWSTKETPNNDHTKGSIKFKNVILSIDDNNNAKLNSANFYDKFRLRNNKPGQTRILFKPASKMAAALKQGEFKHSKIQKIIGSCSSTFMICDLLSKDELSMAAIKYTDFRIVMPNESYYEQYDKSDKTIPVDYSHPDTPYEYG